MHRKCRRELRDGSSSTELSLPRHQVSLTIFAESEEESQEMAAAALSLAMCTESVEESQEMAAAALSLAMCTESVEESQEMAAAALSSVYPGIR